LDYVDILPNIFLAEKDIMYLTGKVGMQNNHVSSCTDNSSDTYEINTNEKEN